MEQRRPQDDEQAKRSFDGIDPKADGPKPTPGGQNVVGHVIAETGKDDGYPIVVEVSRDKKNPQHSERQNRAELEAKQSARQDSHGLQQAAQARGADQTKKAGR